MLPAKVLLGQCELFSASHHFAFSTSLVQGIPVSHYPRHGFVPKEPACWFCSLLGPDRARDKYTNYSSMKQKLTKAMLGSTMLKEKILKGIR